MVIDHDVVSALGLILSSKDKIAQWDEHSYRLNTGRTDVNCDANDLNEPQDDEFFGGFLDSTVNPEEQLPDHLDKVLAHRYLQLVVKHHRLYDGHMRFDNCVIPTTPDYKPVQAKPYSVAQSLKGKTNNVIQKIINTDVLELI